MSKLKGHHTFLFGKYFGNKVLRVVANDPDYILWLHTNTQHSFSLEMINLALKLSKLEAKRQSLLNKSCRRYL